MSIFVLPLLELRRAGMSGVVLISAFYGLPTLSYRLRTESRYNTLFVYCLQVNILCQFRSLVMKDGIVTALFTKCNFQVGKIYFVPPI